MKIIVDKLPEFPEKCLFYKIQRGTTSCRLDEDSPISHCYNVDSCPYLITLDRYLDKRIKEYYNGML